MFRFLPSMSRGAVLLLTWAAVAVVVECDGSISGDNDTESGKSSGDNSHDIVEQLLDVMGSQKCGIVAHICENGTTVTSKETSVDLKCHTDMFTDCTFTYEALSCPEDCQYVEPNLFLRCGFRCGPPEDCALSSPGRPFPNPETKMCEECDVNFCRMCTSRTECEACFDSFVLSDDRRTCEFNLDLYMAIPGIDLILPALVILILLFGIIWRCVKGPHPDWKKNWLAMKQARRHRHLCKTLNWELGNARQVRSFLSFFHNVWAQDCVGVGIPLYHNVILFGILISVLCYAVTKTVFVISGADDLYHSIDDPEAQSRANQIAPDGTLAPVVVHSRLATCNQNHITEDISETLSRYAELNFWAMGILYFAIFFLSLAFAKIQREFAKNFDKHNITMKDYVIGLESVPTDDTDEETLRQWLETELRKFFPKRQRPNQATASELEVFAVSIAYNYQKEADKVGDMIWHLLEKMDMDMWEKAKTSPFTRGMQMSTAAQDGKSNAEVIKEHRKQAEEWFREGSDKKLKGSGDAFAVFRYIDDRDAVLDKVDVLNLDDLSLRRDPNDPKTKVKLREIVSEPTGVLWWYCGKSEAEIRTNQKKQLCWIISVVLLVQGVILVPFALYVVLPYAATGNAAGGIKMTIIGIVQGNINGILFMTIFITAQTLGYPRKKKMDAFALLASTVLCFLMTGFTIATNICLTTRQYAHGPTSWDDFFFWNNKVKRAGLENRLGYSLHSMMHPGMFFMGFIMTMIMAGWVPFLVNTLLGKVIYVWKCFPDRVLYMLKAFLPWAPPGIGVYPFRSAEKAMDPWECTGGNYADHITTPFCCFIMLAFSSPKVYETFFYAIMWGIFEIFYFRYMHLRYHKAQYFTTTHLDSFALCLWGMPLSVIPTVWVLWGLRAGMIPVTGTVAAAVLCILAYVASAFLWWLCYYKGMKPFVASIGSGGIDPDGSESLSMRDVSVGMVAESPATELVQTSQDSENSAYMDVAQATVEETKLNTLVDWLNCNPAYVLKCAYWFLDENGKDMQLDEQSTSTASPSPSPQKTSWFSKGNKQPNGKTQRGSTSPDPPKKTRRRNHPLACGEDPKQVRFFEVGKQYLFIKPERQYLVNRGPWYWKDILEFETHFEELLNFIGKISSTIMPPRDSEKSSDLQLDFDPSSSSPPRRESQENGDKEPLIKQEQNVTP